MYQRAETQSLLLSKVKPMVLHEGTASLLVRSDGSSDETPMKLSRAAIEINDNEAMEGHPGPMIQKFLGAADDLAGQMDQKLFASISDAANSVGNTVGVSGGKLTPEAILAMLEKLTIDFDEHGAPDWPTLVTASQNRGPTDAALEALENDPLYRVRMNGLIVRKREEFRARESDRRLVD
jgi:hypothetical protein